MLKRIFDLALCIVLMILLSPFFLIVTLLILVILGRPVIFKQQRPGINGMPFHLYKFRTMTDSVDKEGNLLDDEKRLIPLGKRLRKLSLDELPQLFNVLRGDISFVGPRPLLMEYLERYNEQQARRHEVKPGITGWAQVNGRNAISWEDKFKLDVWYVDNQTFWLDLKILWITLIKVLKAEGISASGTATMTKFMGSENGENNV